MCADMRVALLSRGRRLGQAYAPVCNPIPFSSSHDRDASYAIRSPKSKTNRRQWHPLKRTAMAIRAHVHDVARTCPARLLRNTDKDWYDVEHNSNVTTYLFRLHHCEAVRTRHSVIFDLHADSRSFRGRLCWEPTVMDCPGKCRHSSRELPLPSACQRKERSNDFGEPQAWLLPNLWLG